MNGITSPTAPKAGAMAYMPMPRSEHDEVGPAAFQMGPCSYMVHIYIYMGLNSSCVRTFGPMYVLYRYLDPLALPLAVVQVLDECLSSIPQSPSTQIQGIYPKP